MLVMCKHIGSLLFLVRGIFLLFKGKQSVLYMGRIAGKTPSEMNKAPLCYKWDGCMDGWDGLTIISPGGVRYGATKLQMVITILFHTSYSTFT